MNWNSNLCKEKEKRDGKRGEKDERESWRFHGWTSWVFSTIREIRECRGEEGWGDDFVHRVLITPDWATTALQWVKSITYDSNFIGLGLSNLNFRSIAIPGNETLMKMDYLWNDILRWCITITTCIIRKILVFENC